MNGVDRYKAKYAKEASDYSEVLISTLNDVYNRIREAAQNGEFEIEFPFDALHTQGVPCVRYNLTSKALERLIQDLISSGYNVRQSRTIVLKENVLLDTKITSDGLIINWYS